MMTREELDEVLAVLGIDAERPSELVMVFYELPDGRIDNFSIGVRRGRRMSDAELGELMRREYPATRTGKVVAVERPEWRPREQRWLDRPEVCAMLKVSKRTVQNWTRRGVLRAYRMGGRVYYDHAEIDRLIRSNAIGEAHRLDTTALMGEPPRVEP